MFHYFSTYDVSVDKSALLLSFRFISDGDCIGSGEFGKPDIGSIALEIFSGVASFKDLSKKLSKKLTTFFKSPS